MSINRREALVFNLETISDFLKCPSGEFLLIFVWVNNWERQEAIWSLAFHILSNNWFMSSLEFYFHGKSGYILCHEISMFHFICIVLHFPIQLVLSMVFPFPFHCFSEGLVTFPLMPLATNSEHWLNTFWFIIRHLEFPKWQVHAKNHHCLVVCGKMSWNCFILQWYLKNRPPKKMKQN